MTSGFQVTSPSSLGLGGIAVTVVCYTLAVASLDKLLVSELKRALVAAA